MVYCCVVGCFHGTGRGCRRDPDVNFYTFPKDSTRRQLWTQMINRQSPSGDLWLPSNASRICSRHFCDDQLIINPQLAKSIGFETKIRRLKDDAVPTLRMKPEITDAEPKRRSLKNRKNRKRYRYQAMSLDDKKTDDWDTSEIDALVDAYNEKHTGPHSDRQNLGSQSEDQDKMQADDDFIEDYAMYDGVDEPIYSDSEHSSASGGDQEAAPVLQNIPAKTKSQTNIALVTCPMCGRTDARDKFFSKSKTYCSLKCSQRRTMKRKKGKMNVRRKSILTAAPEKENDDDSGLNQSQSGDLLPSEVFEWSSYLGETNAEAASVTCFKHVPMWDCWQHLNVGIKVEVTNTDCDLNSQVYWIATVVKIGGYNAKLRYEGFGADNSHDFWLNLCCEHVHPVGWCATLGKPLVPPRTIQQKYLDWKEFLVKRLTGARTLPLNFYDKVQECIHNTQLKTRMRVEVVDKMWVSAMRVARVVDVFGGRCRLQYEASSYDDNDFWIHEKSPLVHYVGWSQAIGHKIHASADYKVKSLKKLTSNQYSEVDATPSNFESPPDCWADVKFEVGMKMEAVDPLNLSAICPASVMKVLKHGHIMIGIDGQMALNGSDWFAFHSTSPLIFPVGFCEANQITLTPPKDYGEGKFNWAEYLRKTGSIAAPDKFFEKIIPKHGFCVGMKLEAVDLMEPRLLCVASVARVVGRLLRVHFDGWDDAYDQWVDCSSPDVYPVGWCEMIGYALEGPPDRFAPGVPTVPKKKKKTQKSQKSPLVNKRRKKKTFVSKSLSTYASSLYESDQSNASTSVASKSRDDVDGTPPHRSLSSEQVAATLAPIADASPNKILH